MRHVTILILIFALLTSCTSQTDATPPAVSETDSPIQPTASFDSLLWKEVRVERFGFGMAVPCWWEVLPMPDEDNETTMTIRNYNDAFFSAYSENGAWIGGFAPQGVLSMDITVLADVEPTLSMIDAYLQSVDTTTYAILSTQEKNINNNIFTVVALKNQINTNEPASIVYLKELTTDSILMFHTSPTEAIFSDDALSIFSSFVGTQSESISIPNTKPSPALIDMACPF